METDVKWVFLLLCNRLRRGEKKRETPLIEAGTRALQDGTFQLQVWQICTCIFNQPGSLNISRLPERTDENGFKA